MLTNPALPRAFNVTPKVNGNVGAYGEGLFLLGNDEAEIVFVGCYVDAGAPGEQKNKKVSHGAGL
jgi:hypothetical protein